MKSCESNINLGNTRMIFDNLFSENWPQLLVNSHVIYATHPTLVQIWWCASETSLMLMNLFWGC